LGKAQKILFSQNRQEYLIEKFVEGIVTLAVQAVFINNIYCFMTTARKCIRNLRDLEDIRLVKFISLDVFIAYWNMFSSPIGMNVHVTAKFIFAWPQNLFFSLCLQIVQDGLVEITLDGYNTFLYNLDSSSLSNFDGITYCFMFLMLLVTSIQLIWCI